MERLLPPELERLERLLARAPRPEPPAALRGRVLGGVRSRLRRERIVPGWRFVAALAATLLIGLSLSLGVSQATVFALQRQESPPSVYEIANRLQQLSPGLSREQSLQQAALRQITAMADGPTLLGDQPCEDPCHDP